MCVCVCVCVRDEIESADERLKVVAGCVLVVAFNAHRCKHLS